MLRLKNHSPQSILIVKLGAIGDVVHTLPSLAALRRQFPKAHIAWLVEPKSLDILKDHPAIDELIVFQRAQKDIVGLWRALRTRSWDWCIDFQGTYKSGLFAWMSGAKDRIGYRTTKEPCQFFYNNKIDLETWNEHASVRSLKLLEKTGFVVIDQTAPVYDISIGDDDRCHVDGLLAASQIEGDFVAMSVVASRPANWWQAAKFKALIQKIYQANGIPVVLVGTMADRLVISNVMEGVEGAYDFSGQTTLKQMAELLSRSKVMIAGDTGPLHLAVGMGTAVLGIYGPTNILRTGPYSERAQVAQHKVDCQPCYKKLCPLTHHRCLQDLEVETVYHKFEQLLKGA